MRVAILAISFVLGQFVIIASAYAQINRVRVVNETNKAVYIHKGGYAPSIKLKPGGSHIFLLSVSCDSTQQQNQSHNHKNCC